MRTYLVIFFMKGVEPRLKNVVISSRPIKVNNTAILSGVKNELVNLEDVRRLLKSSLLISLNRIRSHAYLPQSAVSFL